MEYYSKYLSKSPACKKIIENKGDAAQFQYDYQIEDGKARIIASRYYNKANKLLCSDKDVGKDINKSWMKIGRMSQMEKIHYDLVTRYKVVVPK